MEDIKKLLHQRDSLGFIRAVRALADINIRDTWRGNTLLHEVCHLVKTKRTTKHAKMLMLRGLDVNSQNSKGETTLFTVCDELKTDWILFLLGTEMKADPNIPNRYGETPLHHAAIRGNVTIVKILLDHHAEVNAVDRYGETPLHHAAIRGNVTIVKQLLNHHAKVNICNKYGETPLYYAAKHGYIVIVKMLIEHHAEVNMCSKSGETPLHMAAWMGCHIVADYLLSHGADINAVNIEGQTPLYMSCIYSGIKQTFEIGKRANVDTFDTGRVLALLGADTSIRTNKGDVAFDRLTPERIALLKQLQYYPDNPVLQKLGRKQAMLISKVLLIHSISNTQWEYMPCHDK